MFRKLFVIIVGVLAFAVYAHRESDKLLNTELKSKVVQLQGEKKAMADQITTLNQKVVSLTPAPKATTQAVAQK